MNWGVNVSYVFEAKDGDKNFIKQMNSFLIQPNAGLGLSFAKNGGEHFRNKTMLLGFYVSDAVGNMMKSNGATMNAMCYGIRYTSIVN